MDRDISGMIENRVSSIAALLSEKSRCKVVLTKNSSTPHTDLESGIIYIPPLRVDSLSYENLCVFRRHLDHESFHVRFTDVNQYTAAQSYIESQVKDFNPSLAALSVNIVEDCRIDNVLWSKFPGSITSSMEAFKTYLDSLKAVDLDESIQIAHVVLYGVKGVEDMLDIRSVYRDDIVDGLKSGGFLRDIVQEIQDTVLNMPISTIFEPSLSLYNLIKEYGDVSSINVPDIGEPEDEEGQGGDSKDGTGKESDTDYETQGPPTLEGEPDDGSSSTQSGDTQPKKSTVGLQDWESVSMAEATSSKIASVSQHDRSKIVNLTNVNVCKIKPTVPYHPTGSLYSPALMRSFKSLKGIDSTDIRRSLRRGRVDSKYLYKVGLGKDNVFYKQDEVIDRNVGVCILLDLSSSMLGVYTQVTSTTMVLGNLLQALGVRFNILGYTNKGTFPEGGDKVVPYGGGKVFVESDLDLYVLKTFEESFKVVWRRVGSTIFSVFRTGLSGATPTASALLEAAEFLFAQRSLHKRVLLHVTDGHPTDIITNENGAFVDPFPVVEGILNTLEKDKDFLCLGVGIGDEGIEAVELTHSKYVKVPDIYDLTEDVLDGFEKSILSLYGK